MLTRRGVRISTRTACGAAGRTSIGGVAATRRTGTAHNNRCLRKLGNKPCSPRKHMLGPHFAVTDRIELVHIGRFTLWTALDNPLTRIIIFVSTRTTVICNRLNTVLFIPRDITPCAVIHMIPARLIAIGIIAIGTIPNQGWCMRLGRTIAIGPVIGSLLLFNLRTTGLNAHMKLILRHDVMDRVIGHGERILLFLVRRCQPAAGRTHQTIQIIVSVGIGRRPTHLIGRLHRSRIGLCRNVTHQIIGIAEVLEGTP